MVSQESGVNFDLLITRVIALLQIVGASSASIAMLPQIWHAQPTFVSACICLVMYLIFSLSIISGIWMWYEEARGYRLSVLVQSLQVPVFSLLGITYKFVFGFGILLKILGGGGLLTIEIGGHSYLFLSSEITNAQCGMNLVALFALAFVWRKFRNCD